MTWIVGKSFQSKQWRGVVVGTTRSIGDKALIRSNTKNAALGRLQLSECLIHPLQSPYSTTSHYFPRRSPPQGRTTVDHSALTKPELPRLGQRQKSNARKDPQQTPGVRHLVNDEGLTQRGNLTDKFLAVRIHMAKKRSDGSGLERVPEVEEF